jgi:Cu(I)/Ag(I) efflux system membrane fusion protein
VREQLVHEIRAVGEIAADETRLERVSARVAGRVEKLWTNFTGQPVRRGAPLYSLYSPDLVASEREYLLALENRRRMAGASAEAARSAESLVEASRDRLRLWGISNEQVRTLERTGRPELALTFDSPVSGVVLQKSVVEGQYVSEGTELYLLADLSSVWLVAQVYEFELGRIRPGQAVTATVTSYPGREFDGKVVFVEPVLDTETRTARVRAILPNPRGDLKPRMFADARLSLPLGDHLSIPKSAAIDTGVRQVVYVETSPGSFTPRQVKLGATAGDRREIISGLREGEKVVAAANFFIDSQAQLASGSSIQWSGALEVKTTPPPGGGSGDGKDPRSKERRP